ncbi:hypothetical protein [Microvirga yunnanensis]|uniref:hypothetical protein n=1 Tax=Microvirga yunnanensis TaxID=2953740 RepID=UPI0021C6F0E4|nr:hypothetical protein [Microvirga sp. HBU67655]
MTAESRPPKVRYIRVAEDEVAAFRRLGQSVFGLGWVYRLAAFIGVSTRTAQRWSAGESTVPAGVLQELEEQRRLLRESEYERQLHELVDRILASGLSPHVIAAHLRDAAARVKPEAESTGKDQGSHS